MKIKHYKIYEDMHYNNKDDRMLYIEVDSFNKSVESIEMTLHSFLEFIKFTKKEKELILKHVKKSDGKPVDIVSFEADPTIILKGCTIFNTIFINLAMLDPNYEDIDSVNYENCSFEYLGFGAQSRYTDNHFMTNIFNNYHIEINNAKVLTEPIYGYKLVGIKKLHIENAPGNIQDYGAIPIIATLEIPAGATVIRPILDKCRLHTHTFYNSGDLFVHKLRTNKCIVKDLNYLYKTYNIHIGKAEVKVLSHDVGIHHTHNYFALNVAESILHDNAFGKINYNSYYSPFIYKIGETITEDDLSYDILTACSSGIHFYRTKEEVLDMATGMYYYGKVRPNFISSNSFEFPSEEELGLQLDKDLFDNPSYILNLNSSRYTNPFCCSNYFRSVAHYTEVLSNRLTLAGYNCN